jgi:hypothetical protein
LLGDGNPVRVTGPAQGLADQLGHQFQVVDQGLAELLGDRRLDGRHPVLDGQLDRLGRTGHEFAQAGAQVGRGQLDGGDPV